MPCIPTFAVHPDSSNGFVIVASWPKGHVEQLVGVFDNPHDAEAWLVRYSSEFIAQLGPPSKRVIQLNDFRRR